MQSTKTIVAFLDVLQNQNALFSDAWSDLSDLEQQLEALADEQYDEMTTAIQSFCQNYPRIREAVRCQFGTVKGVGGGPPVKLTPEDDKALREQVVNIIRVNTPPPPPKPKA